MFSFLHAFCSLVLFLWLVIILCSSFCAPLLHSSTEFREVKCSKGLCVKYQQQNRTGGLTDRSNAQQHARYIRIVQSAPWGLLSAGLSYCNVPVQTNVPRVHHSLLPIKPSQPNENTWPADRQILRVWRKKKTVKV